MSRLQILAWEDRGVVRDFRTGVSLHSHTWHSREDFDLVQRHAVRLPLIRNIVGRELARFQRVRGESLDWRSVFWTPPLSPRSALSCEARAIEEMLGIAALVSLSDHDSIEACVGMPSEAGVPISVEWSVPLEATVLHIGVHNLPRGGAETTFQRLLETARAGLGHESALQETLAALDEHQEVLVVLNHPFWAQASCGRSRHEHGLRNFLDRYGHRIHAIEINGLRSWTENRRAMELATARDLPLVSGSDRHGCEPGAVVNLTSARSFSEFVVEVREGRSVVLSLPHARDPLFVRYTRALWDIMRDHPDHERGWVKWEQRVFVHVGQEVVVPLFADQPRSTDALRTTQWFLGAVRMVQSRNGRLAPFRRVAVA